VLELQEAWLTLSLAGYSDSSVRVAGGYVQMAEVVVGLAITATDRRVVSSAPDRAGGCGGAGGQHARLGVAPHPATPSTLHQQAAR